MEVGFVVRPEHRGVVWVLRVGGGLVLAQVAEVAVAHGDRVLAPHAASGKSPHVGGDGVDGDVAPRSVHVADLRGLAREVKRSALETRLCDYGAVLGLLAQTIRVPTTWRQPTS